MDETLWKHRPPGSSWGEFGPRDTRGRMNLVTPAKVRQGVAQVQAGLSFNLSLPLDVPGGQLLNTRRGPPRLYGNVRDGASAGQQGFCWALQTDDPEYRDVVCDDLMVMTLQYSTQWDSFAHWGGLFDADGDGIEEKVFYNGFRAGEHVRAGVEDKAAAQPWMRYPGSDAGPLSISNLAEHGAQGCGVLLDIEHHFGRQARRVGYDDIMRVLDTDGIAIEEGDMVCLHTGYADTLLAMNRQPDVKKLDEIGAALDGHDAKLLNWITDSRLAVLIADNLAVEHFLPKLANAANPSVPLRQSRLPVHEHCLFKHGIHLGELFYLTPLARWLRQHQRHRFLLTAPPLNLPGAVGSPAMALGTV
jgi:hypothetical protein